MEAIEKTLALCKNLRDRFVKLEEQLSGIPLHLHPVRWLAIQKTLNEIDDRLSSVEETVRRGSRQSL